MSAYHICGHTCGTGRLYYNPMVGRYHVCVAYMWLHMWYQPITPLHHCWPVPHVQPHICYTDMVPADCTIIPWSAGTTCATTYMLRRYGTSQYHMCDHLYYMDVVLANHSKYDVVGIGKTGPCAGGKQMYCSQGGVQTRERFTG